MLSSVIRQLRVVGLVEGSSFLLLMGVAMPLKYLAGYPQAVRVVGLIHGILFLIFLLVLGHAQLVARWPLPRVLGIFLAAVVPFGTFLIDGRLRRAQREAESQENQKTK